MRDQDKTKEKLVKELAEMRQRIAALETSEAERKRAEEELRVQRDKFKGIIASFADGLDIVSRDYRVHFQNKMLRDRFSDMTGKLCYEGYMARETPCESCPMIKAIATGSTQRVEVTGADGREYEITAAPFQDIDGEMKAIEVVRDISERKRAEETLEASARQWQTTFDAIGDAISLVDLDGRFLRCNKAMTELLGRPFSEIIGQTCYELVHGTSEPIAGCPIVRMRQTGRRETKVVPIGDRWVRVVVDPLLDEDGRLMGGVHILSDITERKQVREALERRAAQLSLLNDIGGKIAAVLELDSLLDMAVHLVQGSFGYHHVGLFIVDREGSELVMKARAGAFAHLFPPNHRIELGQGMVGWVGGQGETLLANDVDGEPRYINLYPDVIPTWSELSVPIRVGEEIVGVLDVQSPQRNAFDENDVVVMETLANQIAVAIENARLYQVVQQELAERQRAEEALRESEEKHRALIEQSLQGLVVIQDFRIVFANTTFAQISGYTVEELVSFSPEEVEAMIHPEDQALAWGRFRDRLEGKLVAPRYEFRGIRKDGTVCWLEMFASRIEYGGRPAIQGAVVDITERKRAEDALKESEERFRGIVERSFDAIAAVDLEGRMTYVSPAVERILGYKPEEVIGKHFENYFPESEIPKATQAFTEVLEGGSTQALEVKLLRKDGSPVYVESNSSPILKDGVVVGVQGIYRDITERKRAEKEIRKLNQFQERIIDNANVWLNVLDEKANVVVWNKAAEEISGYSREEVVGHGKMWEWLYPDEGYRSEVIAKAVAIMEKGGEEQDSETIIRCKDGQTRIISWNSRSLLDERGTPIGSIALGRDMTERKRAQEALKLRAEQLAALSQASQVVTASLELDQVLAEIVSLAGKVVASDYTSVVLVDEAGHLGQSTETVPGVPAIEYRIRDEGLTSWIVRWRRAVVIDEIGEDGAMTPDLGEGAPRFANPPIVESGVRSLAGLPLMVKDRLLGVLYLHSLRPGAFHGQLPLLTAFVNQAAIAVENARLYQVERKRATQLAVVNQMDRRAASILDPGQLLQEVVTAIQQSFNYYHVGLFLLDEVAGELELRAIAGGFADIAPPDHRLALGEGMVGWTAQTGQPLLANDVSREPHYVPGFLEEPLTKAELCVPLKLAGKVIGVLDVQDTQLNAFDEMDLMAMETLADQLAVSIENAQLYQETVRRLEEARILGAVTTTLTRSLDLDQVLYSIVDSATWLISAGTGGVIHLVDEATGKLIPWATLAPEVNIEEKLEMSIGEGIAGLAAQERRLINVPNVEEDPRFLTVETASLKKSLLTVPLLMDGDCIGTLSLNSDQVGAFSADDEWLLTTLAAQAAIAVKNARLFEQAQQEIAERKRTEEALRESEERYRAIFEQAPDSVVLIDGETGALMEFNDRAHENLGYTRQEFEKLKIPDFDVIESAEEVAKHIEKIIKEGADTFETKQRTKGGEIRDILVSSRAISIRRRGFVQSMWSDITERKRAVEALRESEASYRELADSITDVFFAFDKDLRYTYWNRASENLTGIPAKDALGKSLHELFPDVPQTRRAERVYLDVLKTQEPQSFVNEYQLGGKDFIFEISAYPSKRGLSVFVRDITERKRAEEALRESEERYRAIFEQAPDSVVLIDAETGALMEFNDRAHENLGYTRQEFEKLKVPHFEVIESAEEVAKHIEKIIKEGADTFETKQRTKGGEIRDIQVSGRAISIRGKDFIQGIWRDITERKRAEEEITKHRKDLQRLSAQLINAQEVERGRISQELHDELGQALTAISINLAAIEKELPLEIAPTTRERLAETSSLADQTLEQVRELSLDLRPSMLDDLGLVPTLRWYVNRYAQRLNIEVGFEAMDLEERLTAEVETTLYRVVQEALTNVARHAQANRVHIHLERQESTVAAFIEDDGQGFDVEEVADREPSERGAGLLGMRERVASFGGHFDIQSRPGQGTRLSLEIPIAE